MRCASTLSTSAEQATSYLVLHNVNSSQVDQATLDLVSLGLTFQRAIFSPLLATSGVLFLLAVMAFVQLKRIIKMRSSFANNISGNQVIWKRITLGLHWASVAIVLAVATSLTEISPALQFAIAAAQPMSTKINAGRALQIIVWLAFGFSMLYGFGISNMMKSEDSTFSVKSKDLEMSSGGSAPVSSRSHIPPPPPP
jgi:Ca2+ regulator and membrane fusion protein Fig1